MTLAPAPDTPRVGMSMDDFVRRAAQEGAFEILDEEIVHRMPTVFGHGAIANLIALLLNLVAFPKQLGRAYAELTFVLPQHDSRQWVAGARIPDACFYRQDRLNAYYQATPDHQHKPLALIPDIVVEVVSPNDKYSDITHKVTLYLRDGVRLVWVVDFDAQTVVVHTAEQPPQILSGAQSLTAGDILPDFSIQVEQLFTPTP